MSQRQGIPEKRLLDSLFTPPVDAEDNFERGRVRTIDLGDDDGTLSNADAFPTTITENLDPEFYLDTPDAIYIFDQRLRRAPGGFQVVDVTVDVEEIIGATDYEIQIAKI